MLKQPIILQDEISRSDENSIDSLKPLSMSRIKLNSDDECVVQKVVESKPESSGAKTMEIEKFKKTKNNTNLWSKIRFKFRFINFFITRKQSIDNMRAMYRVESERFLQQDYKRKQQQQKPSASAITAKENSGYFKRSQSTKSECMGNEKRRIKSESEKYATEDSIETSFSSDDFVLNSYLEIYSSPHLHCPQSLKCFDDENEFLLLMNSDNETVDIFNNSEKVLTTFIDLSSSTGHTCVTPVDIVQSKTNSSFFVSDWLNDEIIVYKGDATYAASLVGTSEKSGKYFSSPFGLAMNHANDYLYVCNMGMDSIEVFDSHLDFYCTIGGAANRNSLARPKTSASYTASSTQFNSPKWITSATWGFAISDWDSNKIKLIDRNTHRIVRTFNDCLNPESLTILDSTGTELLVLSSSTKDFIKMYDIISGKLIKAYDYFSEQQDLCSIYGLRGLCVSDQKIYFTDCIKNRIFICNL
jgi:DNA-binding beta-propeller fold protein YncE